MDAPFPRIPTSSPLTGKNFALVAHKGEPDTLFGSTKIHTWLNQNQPLAFGVLLGLVVGSTALLLRNWRLHRADQQRAQELATAKAELDALLRALPDPLYELDREGRLLRTFGQRANSIQVPTRGRQGQTLEELLPDAAARGCREALWEADREGKSLGHQIMLPQGNRVVWVEISAAKLRGAAPAADHFLLLGRDITSTVAATNRFRRQTRLYETLRRCNRAIVAATNRQEMFEKVCALAVGSREVQMVWVGVVDPATGAIDSVASDGQGTDYVNRLHLSVCADHPGGNGPTGKALREDRPFWCADFLHDPITAPWHEFGRGFGWRASASLPLHLRGRVIGGVTFYFGQALTSERAAGDGIKLITRATQSFDRQTQKLLLDLTHDIDMALERFASENDNRALQENLKARESLYRQLTESINDVVWSLDPHSFRFLYVSPSVRRQRGLSDGEVLAAPVQQAFTAISFEVLRIEVVQMVGDFESGALSLEPSPSLTLQQPHADGRVVWTEVLLTPVINERSGLLEVHGVSRDITQRKQDEARIDHLVLFDQLTGLPNREQLEQKINDELVRAQHQGSAVALLSVDLDNFKEINEAYGFEAGDQVLTEVASRLRAGLRGSDALARFSADNFLVLLPETNSAAALHVGRTLLHQVDRPLMVDDHQVRISASVGVASYPDDGDDVSTLVRKAEVSSRSALARGRNQICVFSPELIHGSERNLELAYALHDAIAREQLSLRFQPQADLHSGRIIGAEVLLRWNHHWLGAVSPAEFIPIAESRGLIGPIGDWVLKQALRRLRHWLDQGRPPLVVAVNLSAVQFRNPTLVADITRMLQEANVPATSLELELTESTTMDDPERAVQILGQLSDLGIRLSIDDFGTGYSSFSYLSRFPVNKLKIDQSFVRDLEVSEEGRVIVRAIVHMAHSLSIATIAEGVETPGQLVFLQEQGCDEIQGYLFSRPLLVDDFEHFLTAPPDLLALGAGDPAEVTSVR